MRLSFFNQAREHREHRNEHGAVLGILWQSRAPRRSPLQLRVPLQRREPRDCCSHSVLESFLTFEAASASFGCTRAGATSSTATAFTANAAAASAAASTAAASATVSTAAGGADGSACSTCSAARGLLPGRSDRLWQEAECSLVMVSEVDDLVEASASVRPPCCSPFCLLRVVAW